jgi:hypothetical protein
MKILALFLLLVSSVFLAKADIITVKTYTVKHFTHITGISTKQAIDSGCMNYLKRQVGENTFIFDFDKKTLVINGKAPCKIIDVKDSEDLLDCTVLDNGVKVIYILGDSGEDDYRFLSEWEWEGKVHGYYSFASTEDFTFTVENEFRHLVDYDHFDNKLLERLVFKELNKYRDSLGIVDLLWSDAIYKHVTCKQTDIIVKGSALYHPDINAVFTDEFRAALAKESQNITGIKSAYNCGKDAVRYIAENAFSWSLVDITYERMAKSAIMCWDRSHEGHREAQRAPYMSSGGGKGFVAFSARVNNAKTKVFIFCDFSVVNKEIVELQTETHNP